MPELNTKSDDFVRQQLRFEAESKKHYSGKNSQGINALTFLRVAIDGWKGQHIFWESVKKEAKARGVNTSVFHRRLGKQYDELIDACKEAQRMSETYGIKPRTSGLLQRLTRIRSTIDEYVRICRQHGSKQKRTLQEAMVWEFLAKHLERLKERTGEEERAIKALG